MLFNLLLLRAFAAEAMYHHVSVFNLAPLVKFVWKTNLVKSAPFKIDDLLASPADEMMVRTPAYFIAGMAFS